MKRKLFFLILILILPFSGNVYAAVDIDADHNGATDIEFGGTNGKTEEEALENLGIYSVLNSKQAASDNLSLYSGVTPSTPFLNFAIQPTYSAMSALLGSGMVSQSVTLEHMDTITPTGGDQTNIIAASESNPCTFYLSKNGSEQNWDRVEIFNGGSTDLVLEATVGTLALPGTLTMSPEGSVKLVFILGMYYFDGGNTDAYYHSINMNGGTIQGFKKMVKVSGDVDLVNEDHDYRDGEVWFTAEGNLISKSGYELSGTPVRVGKLTTAPVHIYSDDGSTNLYLKGQAESIGNNKIKLADAFGSWAHILFTDDNEGRVIAEEGSCTEVAETAECLLYDYFEGTPDGQREIARYNTEEYLGTILTPDSEITICKYRLKIGNIVNNITGKDYYIQFWTRTGNDLDTQLAVSDKIDGGDIIIGDNVFLFSTPLTRSTSFAVTIKAVANDAGPNAAATYDGTNYITWSLDNENNSGDMAGGHIATDGRWTWRAAKTYLSSDLEDDLCMGVYTE